VLGRPEHELPVRLTDVRKRRRLHGRWEGPKAGSVLDLIETVPLENTGQGIAWDRSAPGILYAIQRPSKQVVVSRMLR